MTLKEYEQAAQKMAKDEDSYSEAMLAAVKAIKEFDEDRGVPLKAFVLNSMKFAILNQQRWQRRFHEPLVEEPAKLDRHFEWIEFLPQPHKEYAERCLQRFREEFNATLYDIKPKHVRSTKEAIKQLKELIRDQDRSQQKTTTK